MAQFFTGLSECKICNKVMNEGEEFVGFSSFMDNEAEKILTHFTPCGWIVVNL